MNFISLLAQCYQALSDCKKAAFTLSSFKFDTLRFVVFFVLLSLILWSRPFFASCRSAICAFIRVSGAAQRRCSRKCLGSLTPRCVPALFVCNRAQCLRCNKLICLHISGVLAGGRRVRQRDAGAQQGTPPRIARPDTLSSLPVLCPASGCCLFKRRRTRWSKRSRTTQSSASDLTCV